MRGALKSRGIDCAKIRCAAKADITSQGELRNTYLLLTDTSLVFAVSDYSGEMVFSGIALAKHRVAEGISELYEYPFCRLSRPKILNQVVGGLFVVDIDGVERWLCRFTGTRMREMHRFREALSAKLEDREIPEQKPDEPEVCPKCGMPYPERGRFVCPKCMEKRAVFSGYSPILNPINSGFHPVFVHGRDRRFKFLIPTLRAPFCTTGF